MVGSAGVSVGVAVAGSSVGWSGVTVATTSVASGSGVDVGSIGVDDADGAGAPVGGMGVPSTPPIAATATWPDSSVAVGSPAASVGGFAPPLVGGVLVL
jgi:hypothetical protein